MMRPIVLFNGGDAIEFQELELLSSIQLSLMRGVKLNEIVVEGEAKESRDFTHVVLDKSQWCKCTTQFSLLNGVLIDSLLVCDRCHTPEVFV